MNTRYCLASVLLTALGTISGCEKPSDTAPLGNRTTTPGTRTPVADAPKTPMDQSESAAHIKITADIRRDILDDKSMSTNAQNCKVITDKNGLVSLRGVVDSEAEKASIEAKARRIAGATNVDNQLEVKVK